MMTWRQARGLCTGIALGLFVLSAGCVHPAAGTPSPATPAPTMPAFNEARAWQDLLAQVDFGFRVPGTEAHRKTRDWLVAQLTPQAKSVTLQPFTWKLGGHDVQMWNVIAELPGTGPAPRERVLLAAHWDTRPIADHDPDATKWNQPIPGANDGASGVAVLLEIARQLKAHPIARDVTIVFFDGEDYGPKVNDMLLGSKYYAAHLPADKPNWGILLDMVGDTDLDIYRELSSERAAGAVNNRVFTAAKQLGYLRTKDQPGFVDSFYPYEIEDDHTALNQVGVPTADLIDFNYPFWHTTHDTPKQCSATSLKIVGQTVLAAVSGE